jgi:hypothetical protein
VSLSWSATPDVDDYWVVRYQKDGGGNIINGVYYGLFTGLTHIDDGTLGAPMTWTPSGDVYIVKNQFELKQGINVLFEDNIVEYGWIGADTGEAVWLKCNNQDGGNAFAQCCLVTVRRNLWRHLEGAFSISGIRSTGELPANNTETMFTLLFEDNLVYDSTGAFALIFGSGITDQEFNHNTFIHTNHSCLMLNQPSADKGAIPNSRFRNNLFIRNTYGIKLDAGGEGVSALDTATLGDYDFDHNVIGGADVVAAFYAFPGKTNYLPSQATFEAQFKNYGGSNPEDYKLKRISEGDGADSLYLNAGTDSQDIGADIDLILASIAGVTSGNVLTVSLTETVHVTTRGLAHLIGRVRPLDSPPTVVRVNVGGQQVPTEAIHVVDTLTIVRSGGLVLTETLHLVDAVNSYVDRVQIETLHIADLLTQPVRVSVGPQASPTESLHLTDTLTVRLSALVLTKAPEVVHVTETVTVVRDLDTAPTAPVNLIAISVGPHQVTLEWIASTDDVGVVGYRVERCTGAGCSNFVEIGTTPLTHYTDTGLSSKATYRYRVRAYDAGGF